MAEIEKAPDKPVKRDKGIDTVCLGLPKKLIGQKWQGQRWNKVTNPIQEGSDQQETRMLAGQ